MTGRKLKATALVMFTAALVSISLLTPVAGEETPPAESKTPWVTDLDQALALAKEKKLDVFVDFSGSNWCGWCKKLEREVFSQDPFIKGVSSLFVLCLLDFPRGMTLPNAEKNKEAQVKYKITGFPSVLLMDAEGRVYGKTGYRAGGPEKYVEHLKKLADRKAPLFKLIGSLDGIKEKEPRAKKLEEVSEKLMEWDLLNYYGSYLDEFYTIDADNSLGYRFKAVALKLKSAAGSRGRSKQVFENLKKESAELIDKKIAGLETPEAKAKAFDEAISTLRKYKIRGGTLAILNLPLLEKVLTLDPENKLGLKAKYSGDLVFAALNAKDKTKADAYTKFVRELDGKNEHGQLERILLIDANPAFRERRFGDAAKMFEEFLSKFTPKEEGPTIYWAAGFCWFKAGDKAKAKPHLLKVLEIAPGTIQADRAEQILKQIEEGK